jgi:hypothetical protein
MAGRSGEPFLSFRFGFTEYWMLNPAVETVTFVALDALPCCIFRVCILYLFLAFE